MVSAVLLVIGWAQTSRLQPTQESGTLPITPPTPYIHYSPRAQSRGRVLVVHGLDSNKEFMQILSAALADGGFEVFSIDLPGHGDSPAGFEASFAQRAVRNSLEHFGAGTIAVGHSLGAGLLLDLAADRRFNTMVLLSPPPTPIDTIHAERVLVVTGSWDMPRINSFIPVLESAGVPQLEWWKLDWAAHSSAVINPSNIHAIVQWTGGETSNLKTVPRLVWIGVMFMAGAALGLSLLPGKTIDPAPVQIPKVLVHYVAACSLAVLLLKIVVPMRWARIFAMDYLISFLFLAGLILWLQHAIAMFSSGRGASAPRKYREIFLEVSAGLKPRGHRDSQHLRHYQCLSLLTSAVVAAYVIVILGLVAGSHLFHLTLSAGRWWRFPVIAAAALPLFSADEAYIRRIAPRWKSAVLGILTRILLGAFLSTGVLLLNPEDAFLVLVIHVVISFWIALWFATEAVHRNTDDPFAAALFASLVQGWAFAAVFVII